jgi:hypothetical protein
MPRSWLNAYIALSAGPTRHRVVQAQRREEGRARSRAQCFGFAPVIGKRSPGAPLLHAVITVAPFKVGDLRPFAIINETFEVPPSLGRGCGFNTCPFVYLRSFQSIPICRRVAVERSSSSLPVRVIDPAVGRAMKRPLCARSGRSDIHCCCTGRCVSAQANACAVRFARSRNLLWSKTRVL